MVANWMLQPHHAGLLWAWWSFFIACVWFLAIYQPWCQLLVLKRAELAASNPSQINTQLYRGHLSLQLDNWTLLEFPAKSPKKILKMYLPKLFCQWGNNWCNSYQRDALVRQSKIILALFNEFVSEHRGNNTYVIQEKTALVLRPFPE